MGEDDEVEPSDTAKVENGELQLDEESEGEGEAGAQARRHGHRLERHNDGAHAPIDSEQTRPDPAP